MPSENENAEKYALSQHRAESRLPGVSAWAAFFCAAAALLTLGGYIRMQTFTRQSLQTLEARNEALESALRKWADYVSAIDRRIAVLEARARWIPEGEAQALRNGEAVGAMANAPFPTEIGDGSGINPQNAIENEPFAFPPPANPLPIETSGVAELGKRNAGEIIALDLSIKRIMIDLGREDGLESGQTLSVYRNGVWLGDARSKTVYDNISACVFEAASKEFAIGDEIRRQ
jgi:hypothetical protein